MLRRRSLKSSSDLNRRKSTSSTHGVRLEHIDPALAQRDAQIAACQAYTRAQSRANAEMSLFPPTPESLPTRQRSKRSSWGRDDIGSSHLNREGEQGLRRQQSVRFVGPCSVQGKKSSGVLKTEPENTSRDFKPNPASMQEECDTSSLQSYILGNDIQLPSQQSHQPRRAPPPVSVTVMATDYLNVMAAEEECYTPEDDKASAPSSYRHLRRSRSMFSSETQSIRRGQDTPTPVLNGKSLSSRPLPGAQSRRLFHSEPKQPKVEMTAPQLRAPKSMSFLRNRHLLRSGSSTGHDNSTRVACVAEASDVNEGHFETAEHGKLPSGSKTAALFGSRSRRVGSGMRKSLRSSSSESPPPEKAPLPLAEKPDGLKHKARKVSKSFKTKLKSFFTLSRSEEEPPSIPSQHIEAQKTHVTESFGNAISHTLGMEEDVQSEDDWRPIHNVPAKIPSLQNAPPNLLHSNKGSLESLRSENQRDRQVSDESLTSWAHSGPSTLTSQQQQQWREWERQRLSIIKENGMHAPSSSIRRKALGAHLFEQPVNGADIPATPNTGTVDSQRVYSALMRRMKTLNEQVAQAVEQQPRAAWDFRETAPVVPVMGVDELTPVVAQLDGNGENSYTSNDMLDTPTRVSRKTNPGDRQRPGTSGISAPHRGYLDRARREAIGVCAAFNVDKSMASPTETEGSVSGIPEPSGKDGLPLFAPTTHHGHPGEEKAGFSRDSVALASPTSHLFRTESPYRHALQRSMEEDQKVWSRPVPVCVSSNQDSDDCTQIHAPRMNGQQSEADSDSEKDEDYTESIYSSDEVETAPAPTKSSGVASDPEHKFLAGPPVTYQPVGYRESSSVSSVDWKTWLSANIAKLDSSPTPTKPAEVEFALPTMPKNFSRGHVREAAQIYNDDDADYFELPTRKPTLPTTPLTPVEPNVLKLFPTQRSVKRTTPPSAMGKTLPENDSPGGPPPIPARSALRPSPLKISRPGTGRSMAAPSINSSPGLTAAVQRQFGPVSGYNGRGLSHRTSGKLRGGERERERTPSSVGTRAFI
ncbi:hypothetical protein B0T21DRAFT_392666 [Apiosordaria backusii]|uniref:Uncharacterized protein n=1 Tax=Apiosordaria backusii TaxID=314023 RepID=A0AA40BNQ3_9PEZI|nr:hypothetical protein B0T21DRAFT_392666 [Apiosordaria backusii]